VTFPVSSCVWAERENLVDYFVLANQFFIALA
jgi:hypothetical protein